MKYDIILVSKKTHSQGEIDEKNYRKNYMLYARSDPDAVGDAARLR